MVIYRTLKTDDFGRFRKHAKNGGFLSNFRGQISSEILIKKRIEKMIEKMTEFLEHSASKV